MPSADYARIEEAIRYLDAHFRAQPGLKDVADHVGLSEYHFQRLFRRWAGVSPKRFLQYLTAEHARTLLRRSCSVLDASFEVGLSGGGRLHDLVLNVYGTTPGALKAEGEGLTIRYGFHPSPFGDCLVAAAERGLCHLAFVPSGGRAEALAALRERWRRAALQERPVETQALVEQVFAPSGTRPGRLTLLLKGTNFQLKVWEALLRIPPGEVTTYGALARLIEAPGAARAVGTAVGQNPIAYLIPCHRVIQSTGAFGDYRWGATRKRLILGWEAAQGDGAHLAGAADGQAVR